MDKKTDLIELQNLPIAELSELLGALTIAELKELRALEVADNGGRKGALEDIDAALAKLPADTTPGNEDKPNGDPNGDAHLRTETAKIPDAVQPDWQKPDYTGPLHIEQSEWRRVNIKPVREVRTK